MDRKEYMRNWQSKNKKWIADYNRGLYHDAKKILMELKKPGCVICGYSECFAALTFHHVDPEEKLFPIVAREIVKKSNEALLTEFEKCILLCFNCHQELHHCELKGMA